MDNKLTRNSSNTKITMMKEKKVLSKKFLKNKNLVLTINFYPTLESIN